MSRVGGGLRLLFNTHGSGGAAMRRIEEWRAVIRRGGLPRRRRWQLVAAVVGFYLVRDLLLYVALPALLWVRAR